MLDWIRQSLHLGGSNGVAVHKSVTSLLDQGMLAVDHGVQSTVNIGKQTRSVVQQLDSLPAVVSNVVQNIEEPVMNIIRDTDMAARSITKSSHTGEVIFQVLGVGALGWMGWNLFGYVAPRRKRILTNELQQTLKRVRTNW